MKVSFGRYLILLEDDGKPLMKISDEDVMAEYRNTVDIVVLVRNNETKEVREYEMKDVWESTLKYSWSEGNFHCDCNRYSLFQRVGNEAEDEEFPCSHGKYSVRILNSVSREPYYEEWNDEDKKEPDGCA